MYELFKLLKQIKFKESGPRYILNAFFKILNCVTCITRLSKTVSPDLSLCLTPVFLFLVCLYSREHFN